MALLKLSNIKGVAVIEWCEFGQMFLFHQMGFRSHALASVGENGMYETRKAYRIQISEILDGRNFMHELKMQLQYMDI